MSVATKVAGLLLATTAMCGIGSLAATAYADTPTGGHPAASTTQDATQLKSPMYSRGFHVTNLSGNPIKLVSVSGENSWEGRTPDGSVLQPGVGNQDFEMTYYFARDTFNTLNYAMLGLQT